MAEQVILQALGRSAEGERIHDEFERRTGLEPDVRDDGRYYELRDDQQRTRIVRTLTRRLQAARLANRPSPPRGRAVVDGGRSIVVARRDHRHGNDEPRVVDPRWVRRAGRVWFKAPARPLLGAAIAFAGQPGARGAGRVAVQRSAPDRSGGAVGGHRPLGIVSAAPVGGRRRATASCLASVNVERPGSTADRT